MATWAIGDLQGCYGPTQRLLEKIRFDPAQDRLWFCGDLVNRGGESLETLRLVHSLRDHCEVVLGNHDLSLLAISERSPDDQRKVNPDLQAVLFAEDRDELLDWLRAQPLMHVDRELGWAMVHAGLAPKWTIAIAERHAQQLPRLTVLLDQQLGVAAGAGHGMQLSSAARAIDALEGHIEHLPAPPPASAAAARTTHTQEAP